MKLVVNIFLFSVLSCSLHVSQGVAQFIFNSSGGDTTINSFFFLSSCGEPVAGADAFSSVGFIAPIKKITQSVSSATVFSEFILFPNPSQSEIIISSHFPVRKYSLYSSPGILIASGLNPNINIALKISISGFSSGVYYIRMEDEFGNHFHKKFIKQ